MKLKLSEKWQEFLKKQPETGMGYHMVDVTFKDGTQIRDAKVFNGLYLESPVPYPGREISDIKMQRRKLAIRMRIKPPKRRTPSQRLKARLYYRKNRAKIRLQRRKYLRKYKTTLKHRKLFKRFKPVWFKRPPKHKVPKVKKFKVRVPKKVSPVKRPPVRKRR